MGVLALADMNVKLGFSSPAERGQTRRRVCQLASGLESSNFAKSKHSDFQMREEHKSEETWQKGFIGLEIVQGLFARSVRRISKKRTSIPPCADGLSLITSHKFLAL